MGEKETFRPVSDPGKDGGKFSYPSQMSTNSFSLPLSAVRRYVGVYDLMRQREKKGVDGDGWFGEQKHRTSPRGQGREGRISRDGGEQAQGTAWAIPVSRSAKTAQRFSPRYGYVTQGDPIPGERQRRFRMLVSFVVRSFSSVLAGVCSFEGSCEVQRRKRGRDTEDTPCWARVSLSTVEFSECLECLECLEFKGQV